MNAKEAIAYIEDFGWSSSRLGLERTRELLARIGDPQKKLKFIHVAGSNGKGSSCALFERVLREAGYRTGMYISPYIQDFCERIQLCGGNIPGDRLAEITERVQEAAEAMDDHPSQFELVTAIGFEYFMQERCDIVVLEVGMGGALDSTNVIDPPELACITNIGLEHTEFLGKTLEAIARTKSGIIKPGCDCVCYDGAAVVTEVVKGVCAERKVPCRCVDFSRLTPLSETLEGQKFLWDGMPYRINLLGPHQLHNAALVLTGIEALRERGWKIPKKSVLEGLDKAVWPARMEVLGKEPLFILDGGHNPQCADAMTDSLKKLLPDRKVVFLTGVLADKDYSAIMEKMLPLAQEFVCLTPLSGRALPAEQLAEYLRGKGARANAADSYEQGILLAEEKAGPGGVVVAFGSLYMAGEIRTLRKDR